MASYRLARLEEDVHRELTDILRSVKDPRVSGLISVVKVELSSDLSYCKVHISSMDGMESAKEAVKGLTSAAGFIRREVSLRVKMRRSPEFHFVADDSIQHSADIAKILHDLEKKEPVQPQDEPEE